MSRVSPSSSLIGPDARDVGSRATIGSGPAHLLSFWARAERAPAPGVALISLVLHPRRPDVSTRASGSRASPWPWSATDRARFKIPFCNKGRPRGAGRQPQRLVAGAPLVWRVSTRSVFTYRSPSTSGITRLKPRRSSTKTLSSNLCESDPATP
jgi:hypothetical protein